MKKLLFTIVAIAVIASACNKTNDSINKPNMPGKLVVKITDDPFDITTVESAKVNISKIEIRKAGANEGDPFIEIPMSPVTIDIYPLRNGITKELVSLDFPQGDYDLVRLFVDEANLKLIGNDEIFNMKVPSGQQTGIKVFINPVIHVEGGLSTELLLDFELSKSFVMRGHDAKNGFLFTPCIRATNSSTTGRIEGFVKDNSQDHIGIENAIVSFQKDSEAPVTTTTDATGHYAFPGVIAGTYSMSATKESYDTATAEGVVVFPGNKVTQDFVLKGFPVYISSAIENAAKSTLVITYSLSLANIVPDLTAFTVEVDNVANPVTSVTISDKNVLLNLAHEVAKGNIVTVAYTRPAINPLQTADGLQAASLSAQNVTNNVN